MCVAGGLQAIAELLQVDNDVTGNTDHLYNVTMRRYACMALTNLTFADGANKALLCSMSPALRALVAQLESPCEDLCQVAASVLRNLSWHSDLASKRALRDVEAAASLMRSSMNGCRRESTLKSVLSASWNLSSHSADNKADICCVPGALEFLVGLLSYRSSSKTLSVVENAGGILRNVSSHIAVRDDYRAVLRQCGCLQMLLRHLRSPSLTVVSNACGTLWNLSARCAEDQTTLLELGAVAMLKNLVHSRHRMISMGSAAALKNLLTASANLSAVSPDRGLLLDPPLTRRDPSNSTTTPVGLHIRRQRALEDDLNRRQLSETCDDLDSPVGSPTGTLHSPDGARSNNVAVNCPRHRIQSPSPLRLVDRSMLRQSLQCRSSSHAGVPSSHSSDEISGWDRGRSLGPARRSADWWSREPLSLRDSIDELQTVDGAHTMSSFTDHQSSSPSSFHSSGDAVHGGVGASRRFLKSSGFRKLSADASSGAMCSSFLSERTENIHLDDLELKSSCDLDACGRTASRFDVEQENANSEIGQKPTGQHPAALSGDLQHAHPELILNFEFESDSNSSAATADRVEKLLDGAEETDEDDACVAELVPENKTVSQPTQLRLLPPSDCSLLADVSGVVLDSCTVRIQQPVFSSGTSGTAALACTSAQHTTNCEVQNSNKVKLGVIDSSTNSDSVSDIMDEFLPNMTLSTNTDLLSSTDLLTTDEVPTQSNDLSAADERAGQSDSASKGSINTEQVVGGDVECNFDSDVLCCNSAELLSLLEENANRVLRELERKTAESTSSGEVRLLEDETISLVSGPNDNEFDVDDDDDDDDDDYIDAISSRTYDISSASGEAAGLSSRHSSSRSPSSGSSRQSSPPPTTPAKGAAAAGRPRIVKPGESRSDEQTTTGQGKAVRGRRKGLTRPKIPPAAPHPSSAAKPDGAPVRRPSSANTPSATSKQPPAMKTTVQTGYKRPSSATTPRVKQGVQPTPQTKKPSSTAQATAVKRRAEIFRAPRSESTGSVKSAASASSVPSSSSQTQPDSRGERPTTSVKQSTYVKADGQQTDKSEAGVESSVSTSAVPAVQERAAVQTATKPRSRPSSATSTTSSNKPKPSPPARVSSSTTSGRLAAASKVGLRHSSPTSGARNVATNRASQPSAAATAKPSSSASSAAVGSASSPVRGIRSPSAASPVSATRKPISSQAQSPAKSNNTEVTKKPDREITLPRTSTYDKLDDADKTETGSVNTVIEIDPQRPISESTSDEVPAKSEDCQVLENGGPLSRGVQEDCGQLSEGVIRRARQLVEQADQIQTRRVSPPQSIRFSSGNVPAMDDVIQRPIERPVKAHVDVGERGNVVESGIVDDHVAEVASSTESKPKLSSSTRKFGFIGLLRRQRPDTATGSGTVGEPPRQDGPESTQRRPFTWWRRHTTTAATNPKPGDRPTQSAGGGFGRSASKDSTRSAPCRAAVVTPFNYRPTAPPPPMFADLPESHQTKTAMLIERRQRRLKMASESNSEQTASDNLKSKPDTGAISRRKNLLVTTV